MVASGHNVDVSFRTSVGRSASVTFSFKNCLFSSINRKRPSSVASCGSDASLLSTLPLGQPEYLESGALFEYYPGEFDTLPEFNALSSSRSCGVVNTITVNATTEFVQFDPTIQFHRRHEAGNFAARFTAMLKIPHAGLWTFYLCSNDGSALYVNGKRVILNDGLHYSTEKEGRLRIKAPGFYPITILYFHKQGKLLEGVRAGPTLTFSYYFPGSGWLPYPPDYVAKQIVPTSALFYNPMDDRYQRSLHESDSNHHETNASFTAYDHTLALEQVFYSY